MDIYVFFGIRPGLATKLNPMVRRACQAHSIRLRVTVIRTQAAVKELLDV
jgi:hypothetical protein